MSEENKEELTKEKFIEEMTRFEQVTANQILEVLEENKHILSVEVLGLISIARVLINNFGDDYLMDTAVNYLTYKTPEENKIKEAPDMVEEKE